MLEAHESGFTFSYYFRRAFKHYLVVLGLLAAAAVLCAVAKWWPVIPFFFGLAAGFLLRDIGWVRGRVKAWPFSEKIIDWDRVRELAEGSSVD